MGVVAGGCWGGGNCEGEKLDLLVSVTMCRQLTSQILPLRGCGQSRRVELPLPTSDRTNQRAEVFGSDRQQDDEWAEFSAAGKHRFPLVVLVR